jgi:pilus assembly protein Flp/PilA
MNTLSTFIKGFMEDESGLTAVEYAVAGGLVVGGMVTAFIALGTAATGKIDAIATAVG